MATDSTDGPAAATSDGVQVISDTSAITATSDSAGTASGGSDRRIDGAEGDDNATQLTQASAIALMPKAGEWIVIRVEAGDRIEFPFSLAGAEGVLKDGNVELRLPNGGVVVLQGYLAAIEGEPPLQLTDANGDVVDLEDFIVAIDELEELGLLPPEAGLETQEQGAQQQTNPVHDGGANFAPADPIAILDGLQEAGALLGTALAFELESQDDREGGFEEDRGPTDLIWSIVGDSTVTEGTTGAYTVSYTGAALSPGQTATIAVATGGGFDTTINDAGSGADFQPVSTVLTFTGGGTTSQTLSVTIFSDTILEGSEDYTVTIASPTAGTVATSQANTVITDDDNATVPVWSVAGSSVVGEGDGPALYTVSYTGAVLAPGQTLTIAVASSGGFDSNLPNATSGADFTALSTVLTFTGGGTTSQTVSVGIVDDTIVESDEDYTVTIADPTAGSVGTSQANTIITDDGDSSLLNWAVSGPSAVEEGDSATYTVSYTGATLAPGQVMTILVGTDGGFDSALSDAQSGSDYTALSTILTFTGGGATSHTVAVSTVDDTIVESDEDYTVTIASPTAGTVATSQANTVIIDDGDSSLLSWTIVGTNQLSEGDTANYTVAYTGATLAPGQTMTIAVATDGGFDTSLQDAQSDIDYTALSTVLTFTGGGATSHTVSVSTIDDTVVEAREDYTVTIASPTAGTVATSQANTVIIDDVDESLLSWTIGGSSLVTEGDTAEYTVSYTGATLAPGQTMTIAVAAGGGFNTALSDAISGTDYSPLNTVLTFTGGATSQTVQVSIINDTVVEGSEDYTVRISDPFAGTIVTSQANTVILDSDSSLLSWTIVGSSLVTEGDTANYTVSYTGATLAPGQVMTIVVSTSGGFDTNLSDAQAGSDYTGLNTTLTFTGGGATSQTVAVSTIEDTSLERTEDYTVTIASPTAGTVATSQANTVITDDDGTSLVWHIGGGGPAQGGALITGSSSGGGDDDGNGGDGDGDETLGGGGDGDGDGDGGSTGIVWSINGTNSIQENAGTALYTISYTGPTLTSGQTALVTVGTGAGTNALLPNATSPGDFGAVSTTLTFTAGTGTTRTMAVTIVNDGTAETAEDYSVTIGGVSTGQIGNGQANTVIEIDGADGQPAPIWSIAGTSSVEEGASAIYTIAYAGTPLSEGQTARVTVATTSGFTGTLTDAVSPSDFGAVNAVLTFTRGTGTAQTIQVSTIDNGVGEGSEDYRVTISGQTIGTLGTTQANTIITEETGTVLEWSINGQAAVTEGGTAVYTISYDGPSLGAGQTARVTVGTGTGDIATLPNATAGLDFGNLSTVLTFTSGSSPNRTIGVTTINDTAAEPGEDYSVRITSVSQGVVTTSQVDTVISIDPADGDVPIVWNVTGDSVVSEGGFANYTVSYTGDRIKEGETETVVVTTAGGFTGTLTDAAPNIDYGSLTTTLTFTAGGRNQQTFSVSTVEDTNVEGDEDYTVRITGTSFGQVNLSQANTVIDDQVFGPDIDWHITGDPIAGEMNGVASYTVGYTGDPLAPGETATVTVGTGSGWTATLPDAIAGAGGDYTALNTVLTFTGGGVTQRTVGVSIVFDTLNEGQEDYTVTIGGASAGSVVTSQANTVIDQVNNATTVDENAGPAVYTIWYTGAAIAPGVTVTIAVATNGGFTGTLNDATGNTDYTSVMTTLTFTGGGATFQTIAVSLIDDTQLEGNEDYTVTIGNQSDGSIGTSQSNTVIVDDEATSLVWNVTGASQVNEGDTGLYTVSYTGASIAPGQTALVTVQTGIADADPNDAIPNADYTALTTILTFTGGGATSKTVAVSTIEDTLAEATEDYQVEISSSSGTVGTGEQHTNIVDDDGTSLVWSIGPSAISVDEAEHQVATVSYTGAPIAPGFTALVTVSTGGGWGTFPDATPGVDFTSFTTTLTFTSGTGTTQTLGLSTIGDTLVEGTEDYTVTIGGVSHGSVGTSQSNVSIIDDDGTSLVWNVTGNVSVAEGSSTTYTVSYTGAALAPGAVATIVVASADAPGGFPNATPGNDYTALPSTTLTFTGGGATQQTVVVSTMQDTLVENIEDYAVVLGNQSVGGFGTSQATTNIIDNDGTSLSWNLTGSATVTEGGAPGQYTVSYTGATLAPGVVATITVATGLTPATTPPDATPNVDYTSLTTVLTFTGGGATQQIVQVSTINDSFVEPTEDYRVTISGQSVGNISDGVEVTNIAANDTDLPRWSINGSTAIGEGGSGIYTVTYTNAAIAPGQTATITVNTANSTLTFPNATAGSDYTALTTVLTFTAGTGTSRTVSVSALVDTNLEGTEDFQVTIGGQSHGQVVAANNHVDSVIVDVSGDFRVNEVSIGALVTAPGGVATSHWIELRNTAGNAQLTTSINVEILGATGGVKTVVLPGLSVPAGGFIVLYEQGTEARYGVYDAAGVLQSSGAIAGGGSWNFGTNTAQRVGVNIVASGASTDLFIANGATPGSFTGAPTWTSPGLSGGGYAAAAGLFGGSFALLVEQASYNGQVDNQTTILQRLGLRATPPVTEANNDVFLRVDTTDGNNGTDWTTANASGDTAGALNNASYANPNDSTETITHNQTTTPAGEGQDILHAAVGGGATINGNNDNDFLYGNAGIDTLVGGSGDDFLFGHSGNDRLFGGPGSDLLVDVSGTLAANAGEYMEGGTGHDILLGTYGASANTAFMLLVGDVSLATAPNNGTDWIAGGNNADTILGDGINFAAFSQAIFLANPLAAGQPLTAYQNRVGSGSDTLLGFGGNDRIGGSGGLDSILGGTGEDTIDGDSDGDVLQGEDGSDSINGGGGSDQIWGDESDGGGTGDDTLWGESGSDLLVGGGGSDYAQGNSGNDFLEGDFGDDTLHGGMNDDTLVGGPGIDLYGLDEAAGGVLFNFADASPAPGGWQVMNLGAYGLGTDWFREMEGVAAGAGDDTIVDGIGGGQYYQGNGGNDSYTDGEGQDTYDMGGGPGDHDTLSFGSITLTAVPNVVIGFGTFFDATPPDTGDQDYIDIDAIFDAFGVSDANRTNPAFVRIFDPGPGPAPVELQVDVDGPGVGTFVTLMIFQGITSGGSLSIGNSASDDIQVGSL